MNIDKLQEAVEQIAKEKLAADIKSASKAMEELIDNHPVLRGVAVRLLNDEGNKSFPYLSQLFTSEYVKTQIYNLRMHEYTVREINKLLKTDEYDER